MLYLSQISAVIAAELASSRHETSNSALAKLIFRWIATTTRMDVVL